MDPTSSRAVCRNAIAANQVTKVVDNVQSMDRFLACYRVLCKLVHSQAVSCLVFRFGEVMSFDFRYLCLFRYAGVGVVVILREENAPDGFHRNGGAEVGRRFHVFQDQGVFYRWVDLCSVRRLSFVHARDVKCEVG